MTSVSEKSSVVDHAPVVSKATKPTWYAVLHWGLFALALVVLVGLLALGVAVRRFNMLNDFALGNIAFIVCVFLGVLPMIGWLSVFALRGWKRVLPPLALFLLIAAPFPFVKIREVDGEMIPVFAWRFSPDPDELLEVPPPVDRAVKAVPVIADLATVTPGDFPQFLGPDGKQHIESLQLDKDWKDHPPKLVWQQPIGAGWSAFATRNGFAVTMEQRGDQELVTCYEIATGNLVWSHGVATRYETVLGGIGPRATPTIDESGMVFANGATGILRCINGNTGQLVWQQNILKALAIPADQDATAVLYGRSNSPLVYDDVVVVPGGAGTSLVAFDRATGDIVWRGGDAQIGYATPVLAELGGIRQILSVNESTVSGHDASDGRQLWQFPWPGGSSTDSNNSQPIAVADDKVFVSKSYGTGAALWEVKQGSNMKWEVNELWHNPAALKTKFTNVIVHDGYVYGLSDGIMECVDLNTGGSMWKKGRFHQGQILGVGDVILVMNEKKGTVTMIDMSPESYNELGRFQALDTDKVWNHVALYGNKLLVRDAQTAACWELPVRE